MKKTNCSKKYYIIFKPKNKKEIKIKFSDLNTMFTTMGMILSLKQNINSKIIEIGKEK